jgi:zinc-binding alcohol dehydrogenase family protein
MKTFPAVYDEEQSKTIFTFLEQENPPLGPKDIRVRVKAISVNPVDYKKRASLNENNKGPMVLGWDVAGVVEQIGNEVAFFKKGDEVYYAGAINRAGGNADLHIVDERIVGKKPKSLSFVEAAALPLTTITAYEALFDQLGVQCSQPQDILIIGGAGGVGSIAIQLIKKMTKARVIVTAGRQESEDWVKSLGADKVIDYRKKFVPQLKEFGISGVDAILCFNDTAMHFENMAEAIKPFGKICTIVESEKQLPMGLLKSKSVTFSWEFMFTRSLYHTPDILKQQELLNEVSAMVDEGKIKTTMTKDLGVMSETTLQQAHDLLLTNQVIGKICLQGI